MASTTSTIGRMGLCYDDGKRKRSRLGIPTISNSDAMYEEQSWL